MTGDKPYASAVDVIIPLYRGLRSARACVDSVQAAMAGCATPCRLILIDDASPEPALRDWLAGLEQSASLVLLRNERNQGFVRSVNRGMALHPDRDVVLLNSDTLVHGDWLDRLRRCAYAQADTATVTPLTNNGTLAGYPRFMRENPIPTAETPATLDALAAEVNAGRSVTVPTAVGFCMYIRRHCLDAVGYFDATAFGRGYGEETDFCRRAEAVGFSHRLAGDVFVYHEGGVSFGEAAEDLQRRAASIMAERYPDYDEAVAAHVRADPARPLRARLSLARLERGSRPRVLFIGHREGGGVEKHCRDLARMLQKDVEVLELQPDDDGWLRLFWRRDGEDLMLHFRQPDEYEILLAMLRRLGVSRVHVHHVMEQPHSVLRIPAALGVPMDFTAHDYYAICPQYNLTDEEGEYCGEPDAAGCERCLAVRPAPWGLDIHAWRQLFSRLLRDAERVFAPSQDVGRRLQRYVPDAPVVILPHPEPPRTARTPAVSTATGPVRVLVLGVLNPAKGVHLLTRCARDARERGLDLEFHVIGWSETPIHGGDTLPLTLSGAYRSEELPSLISRAGGDVFFFPSRAPETFSYTLSEALAWPLPIIAPARGAFVERLSDNAAARLLDPASEPAGWNQALLDAGHAHRREGNARELS